MTDRRVAPTGVALRRFQISPEASETITGWAWGLADGTIRLWQLPDAINTFFTVAFEHGRRSRDGEVHALRVERDRHWLLALPADERRQLLLDRLDGAARLTDSPDVDNHLDAAWRTYLASLNNIGQPIALHSTEHGRKVA